MAAPTIPTPIKATHTIARLRLRTPPFASAGVRRADPVWSARGNMTSVPKPSDLTAVYTATYDAWNRLVEVKSGETVVAKYEYDGLNHRIKAHIDAQAPAYPDGVDHYRHFFYNSGWQILETRKATSENTGPETLQPEVQYVWSLRYIDAAVLRDENTDQDDLCDDERLYYLTDANMNVTCLTDTGGDAVERYVYDPYGNCTVYNSDWSATVAWAASKKNNIRFCGYYFDNETGLYTVRHRIYHPRFGLWVQREPIGYADGMNLYQYVGGNPVTAADPEGLRDYKLGIVAPQVIHDPGAGVWNSEELELTMWVLKQEILSALWAVEVAMPNAGAHLRHYFGNSGSTYTINLEGMIKDVPVAKALYVAELEEAKDFAETLREEGEYRIISGAVSAGRIQKADSLDWFFAVAGYKAWGRGLVNVKCGNDGQYVYKMVFAYEFRDRYNWDEGKDVPILGVTITDEFMGKFHRQGLAREFDMEGTVVETIRWKKGENQDAEPNPSGVHDGRN